jgi:hypothetical protein
LVEHKLCKLGVRSSNLLTSTRLVALTRALPVFTTRDFFLERNAFSRFLIRAPNFWWAGLRPGLPDFDNARIVEQTSMTIFK